MAYKRIITPLVTPDTTTLNSWMVGIGLNFSGSADHTANLEDTLYFASTSGMEADDLRVLAVLTTWLGVHVAHINVDRMTRIVNQLASPRVKAYWVAVAHMFPQDKRFGRLRQYSDGEVIDLLRVGSDFQMSRRGEDERFPGSILRVPKGTLRHRLTDVLTPQVLLQRHKTYRNRVLMGPSWRADVWTALEEAPNAKISEIARRSYASFATAWQVSRDFYLMQGLV